MDHDYFLVKAIHRTRYGGLDHHRSELVTVSGLYGFNFKCFIILLKLERAMSSSFDARRCDV